MTFDKLFNKQNLLVKILLLIIPGVNIVTEVLVRVSAFLRNKDLVQLVLMILASIIQILPILDIISLVIYGRLAFTK